MDKYSDSDINIDGRSSYATVSKLYGKENDLFKKSESQFNKTNKSKCLVDHDDYPGAKKFKGSSITITKFK